MKIVKRVATNDIIATEYVYESIFATGFILTAVSIFSTVSDKGVLNVIIPSVAKKDICKLMLIAANGFTRSSIVTAAKREFSGSGLYFEKNAQNKIICIIPALITDGVKPVSAIKKTIKQIEMTARSLRLFRSGVCFRRM